jgi:uncharacterized protein YkwD
VLTAATTLAALALTSGATQHVAVQNTTQRPAAHRAHTASALESSLLREINATRAQHGLRALRWSTRLTAAADQHSGAMAAKGFFAHESANGGAFWRRIAAFYGYGGYRQWSVGENLLWSSPDVTPSGALRMWMNSPPHRENLLSRDWREIGLSAVHAAHAPGVYGGSEVTIVTADFGVRY